MESEAIMRLEAIIWPLFYSGAFYLIFVGLLTLLFGYIERRLGYFKLGGGGMAILEVKKLVKSFGSLCVLDGIDFRWRRANRSRSSARPAAAKRRCCAA
jgi:hypothetical protein